MFCFYLWAIAQIILESFPISSSGHSALLLALCPCDNSFLTGPIGSLLGYALHLPTAIIIFIFFAKQWSFPFIHYRRCWKLILKISGLTALACIVTVAGYSVHMLFDEPVLPLPIGFLITALSLFSLRWLEQKTPTPFDVTKAIVLGGVQALAFMPGISRFALTYVAARWLHIPVRRAFEISFLIQWPLIICASVYSFFVLHGSAIELLNLRFVLVMLGASMIAYGALYMVSRMVKKEIMWWWSIYMLVPIALSIILGVMNA